MVSRQAVKLCFVVVNLDQVRSYTMIYHCLQNPNDIPATQLTELKYLYKYICREN